jgi:hypothetical protein
MHINKPTIDNPTWIIHCIPDNVPGDHSMSMHTHGLDKYNSLELELKLDVDFKEIGIVLNKIGLVIANGRIIKNSEIDTEFCLTPVIFMEIVNQYGDRVLRVVCSDEQSRFPWDAECDEFYIHQLMP